MKKEAVVIIMLGILLISAGCASLRQGTAVKETDYHTGTDGLVMNLIKNLPPDNIWKGNDFVIGLELRNKGAHDIEDGIVRISGFDPRYIMPAEDEQTIESLAGKGYGYPEGDYAVINFHAKNIDIPAGAAEYPAAFTIKAEYDYKTEASAVVCVNPNMFKLIKTKDVCEVKTASFSGGQGAPVAITQIEESITPLDRDMRVEFIIYIANKGDGKVLGNVNIDSVKLSEKNIECNVKEFKIIGKDENKVYCPAVVEKGIGARNVPLSVALSYRYESELDKKIKVSGFVGKTKSLNKLI